jgi:hypothetical protein
MFSSFSRGTGVPETNHPLAAIWSAITALQSELEEHSRRLEAETVELSSGLEEKLQGLKSSSKLLSQQRAGYIDVFNRARAAGTCTASDEDAFWAALALQDIEAQRIASQVDEITLRIHFPPSKGYLWKFVAPGVFMGLRDFWLERFSARSFSLELRPGRGDAWEPGSSGPTLHLLMSGLSFCINFYDLSLRGDQIPSTLRNVQQAAMAAEAELDITLVFESPLTSKASSAGASVLRRSAVQQPRAESARPGASALLDFQWRVRDSFKFEVRVFQDSVF